MVTGREETRQRLSRPVVVHEAIRFVDREGLPALTMRRLGRQLGVEAMSLYRYVNGREDLLEAMVDQVVSQLRRTEDSLEADTWQAYLQWLAHSVRQVATDHPHLFPLVATRNPATPWLRPPLRSLDVVEDFLDALLHLGFTDAQAVRAYQMFSSFLLGHLLIEAAQRSSRPTVMEEQLGDSAAQEDLSDYPLIMANADQLSQDRADEEFEETLELVLDRLAYEIGRESDEDA